MQLLSRSTLIKVCKYVLNPLWVRLYGQTSVDHQARIRLHSLEMDNSVWFDDIFFSYSPVSQIKQNLQNYRLQRFLKRNHRDICK